MRVVPFLGVVGSYRCGDNIFDTINITSLCDGKVDCAEGDDETNYLCDGMHIIIVTLQLCLCIAICLCIALTTQKIKLHIGHTILRTITIVQSCIVVQSKITLVYVSQE